MPADRSDLDLQSNPCKLVSWPGAIPVPGVFENIAGHTQQRLRGNQRERSLSSDCVMSKTEHSNWLLGFA